MTFHDDMIRRTDLPRDVFELLHDLAYDHEGRDRTQYQKRAQRILEQSPAKSALAHLIQALETVNHLLRTGELKFETVDDANSLDKR